MQVQAQCKCSARAVQLSCEGSGGHTVKKKPFIKESSISLRVTFFAFGATTSSSSCRLPRQRSLKGMMREPAVSISSSGIMYWVTGPHVHAVTRRRLRMCFTIDFLPSTTASLRAESSSISSRSLAPQMSTMKSYMTLLSLAATAWMGK